VYEWVCGCVYKIEKFRTLSARTNLLYKIFCFSSDAARKLCFVDFPQINLIRVADFRSSFVFFAVFLYISVFFIYIYCFFLSSAVLLCSGRRVKVKTHIVFTSGGGKNHEWFLESLQVKIMFLLF
jgi:hypothetical protein